MSVPHELNRTLNGYFGSNLSAILMAGVLAFWYQSADALTAEEDFQARCSASGVVLCNGFDSASAVSAGIQTAGDGSTQGMFSTDEKTSGAGSLRFTFRSGIGYANIGGAWSGNTSSPFSSGDTIYIQYRWKATPSYFSNNNNYWRSSIKHVNMHGSSSTCQGSEFTTILSGGRLSMYTNCGDGWFTDVNTNERLSRCTADCLIQQGANLVPSPNGSGYNCHYQNQFAGIGDGDGCFEPVADKWYTIYQKIQLGRWGGSDTTVEAWESHDGSPLLQFHRVNGVTWNNNRDDFFNRVRLETYMTEISRGAPTPAYIWYDELIVSKQPIAPPGSGGPVPLTPPRDLEVAPSE